MKNKIVGGHVPSAKIVGERRYSIISDDLGTPVEAYDEVGKRVWKREQDIYGRTRSEVDEVGFIPFLYQGQYLDTETGLAYSRFRYYSPETGAYISQDPIRLGVVQTNLYVYLHDVNIWVAPWGLKGKAWFNYAKRWHDKRADEIFGVGKGRSVSGRHYDKTYKGRDIEFKSDNFSKEPRSKESLERMQKQLNKIFKIKKRELLILISILSMTQVLFLRCKIY